MDAGVPRDFMNMLARAPALAATLTLAVAALPFGSVSEDSEIGCSRRAQAFPHCIGCQGLRFVAAVNLSLFGFLAIVRMSAAQVGLPVTALATLAKGQRCQQGHWNRARV